MLRLVLFKWIALASSPDAQVAGHDCAEASRARLEAPYGYDAVRVTVAPGQAGAAVTVSVAGADRWTSLRATEGGVSTVSLDPTERGGVVTLAIEPDLDAPVGACVQSIELLRGGDVIGSIALTPKS